MGKASKKGLGLVGAFMPNMMIMFGILVFTYFSVDYFFRFDFSLYVIISLKKPGTK